MTTTLRPAPLSTQHLTALCRRIAADQAPITVTCQPLPNQPVNECFLIIPEHTLTHGGETITGWAIWERAGVFIEAEFHAVWRSPTGEYPDLATRPTRHQTITFLPDPHRHYQGRQIDNIRQLLVNDPDVTRFLYLGSQRIKILETHGTPHPNGGVTLPPVPLRKITEIMQEMIRLDARITRRYPRPPH